MLCSALLYYTILYSTMIYCTILYFTLLYSTPLFSTLLQLWKETMQSIPKETKEKWACHLHLQKKSGDVTPIRDTTPPSYNRHIYNVILSRIILYCALLYYTIPYSTMISYIILYSTLLCYALLFSTVLQLSREERECTPTQKDIREVSMSLRPSKEK